MPCAPRNGDRSARVSLPLPLVLCVALCAASASAQPVAERVSIANAPTHLFGGTDADGGIDDWYLSNGVVEAIIDDVGPQTDLEALLGIGNAPPKQNEAAFTGGSLLDFGRVGRDNDQLTQMFTVGGLSTSNFILYDTISAATTPTSATITVTGTLVGFEASVPASDLQVVTEYTVAGSDPFVTITSTVTNQNATETAAGLAGFLDVFLWTSRSLVPFSPLPDRGFRHAVLDFANLIPALEQPAFAAAPGAISPADGIVDPNTLATAGEVAYGVVGDSVSLDPDGAGPLDPVVTPVHALFGVSNTDLTAFGNLPAGGGLPAGGVLRYVRRVYVGERNEVAAVANDILGELAVRRGFATGTISGSIGASDAPGVVANVVATRTGGVATPGFATNAPITHFRTDANGAFGGVVLPVGTYSLEFRSVERDPVTVAGVVVAAGTDTAVSAPQMTGLGTVTVEILEAVPGPDPRVPGKVTFVGRRGDPSPRFNKDLDVREFVPNQPDQEVPTETFAGSLAQQNLVYFPDGSGSIQLRPGRYEIFGSRGPEYTVRRKLIRVREGRTRNVKLRLRRLVETPGALSADFHIHSARSLDTQAAVEGRAAAFAGEGVEVMVSTDHDFVLDYAPVIAAMNLTPFVTSIVGSEVTGTVPNPPAFPNSTGHINAWPLTVDPDARRDGAVEDEFVAPNWNFSRLRNAGARVIQYNHPRAGVSGITSIGLFSNIGCGRCANAIDQLCSVDADCPASPGTPDCTCVGYQPDRLLTEAPNNLLLSDDITGTSGIPNPDGFRNIDFDAMEIGNGTSAGGYVQVRNDWFSLLNQFRASTPSGPVPFIVGTGVSDSHRLSVEAAGYFRSYVLGAGETPQTLDAEAFDASVTQGRVMATTGPFIEFQIRDGATVAGLGETLVPTGSSVILDIRVQASNWIPVHEIRVVSNGQVVQSFDATTTPAIGPPPKKPWAAGKRRRVRFEAEVPLTLDATDQWILVEAGERLDPLPVAAGTFPDTIVPGLESLAFTNPIFIDRAGDGFDPPGLTALPAVAAARTTTTAVEEEDTHAHRPIYGITLPADAVAPPSGE